MFSNNTWGISFYYGNSKSIFELELNNEVKLFVEDLLEEKLENFFSSHRSLLNLKSSKLQDLWTNSNENYYPFEITDKIGELVTSLIDVIETKSLNIEKFYPLFEGKVNQKIINNFSTVIVGLIVGSTINTHIDNEN